MNNEKTKQEDVLYLISCLNHHKYNFDYCLGELIKEVKQLNNIIENNKIENKLKYAITEFKILRKLLSDIYQNDNFNPEEYDISLLDIILNIDDIIKNLEEK